MRFWSWTGFAVALVALAITASAATRPVQNSKHNMTLWYGLTAVPNREVCLPCHAPHGQPDKTQTTLWNHVMPANTYVLFGTGSSYDTGLDLHSRKCLSCHDGTVAPDSFGYNGGIHRGSNAMPAGFVVGNWTRNLKHDHPVGVKYPGANPDGTWTSTSGWKDSSRFSTTTYQTSILGTDGNFTIGTYVKKDGSPVTPISDSAMIALVPTLSAAPTDKGTVVGCTTCHTPHDNTYKFLRFPNTNSQMCLTCHDK